MILVFNTSLASEADTLLKTLVRKEKFFSQTSIDFPLYLFSGLINEVTK